MAFSYKSYNASEDVSIAKKKADQYSTYNESERVTNARNALDEHSANKVADWTGGTYGTQVKDTLNAINNRQKFSYDVNADALYQQYKDKYINQGRLAMADTVGQASALTGGYGNSYAVTAGNQAYQSYLQNLNDVVPQLYELAYNKYNQEGQDLKDKYNLLNQAYNTEYGEYRDQVSDWNATYDRLQDAYYNEANMDWNQFSSNRDYYTNQYKDIRDWDYKQYDDAYSRAFDSYKQSVSEDQFNKQLAYQYAALAASKSGGSGGGGGGRSRGSGSGSGGSGSSSNKNLSAEEYLNKVRQGYGVSAANDELNRLIKSGTYKTTANNKSSIAVAAIAARGGKLTR